MQVGEAELCDVVHAELPYLEIGRQGQSSIARDIERAALRERHPQQPDRQLAREIVSVYVKILQSREPAELRRKRPCTQNARCSQVSASAVAPATHSTRFDKSTRTCETAKGCARVVEVDRGNATMLADEGPP